jgi:uncharacterized protein
MIEIRSGRLGQGVYATGVLEPGHVILRGWGHRVPHRTRHSFQVGMDTHIVVNSPMELLNHSCAPNCGVLIRPEVEWMEIHALRRIEPGEELTTDYATFEYEILFMPGPCLCGTPSCRGKITGYKDLPTHRRDAFGPYIAPYLRELDSPVPLAV